MLKILTAILLLCLSYVAYVNWFEKITTLLLTPTYKDEQSIWEEFPATLTTNDRDVFIFDPQKDIWAVYDKSGKLVGAGRGSGGKDYCPDIQKPCRTVVGEFTVFRKEDKDCTSKTFPIDEGGGAPMPHCMFFFKGYAIHGSNNIPDKNASHGCIRVTKKAAKWMNENYIKPGAMVVVLPYAPGVN